MVEYESDQVDLGTALAKLQSMTQGVDDLVVEYDEMVTPQGRKKHLRVRAYRKSNGVG
jgi:hypothetical protein